MDFFLAQKFDIWWCKFRHATPQKIIMEGLVKILRTLPTLKPFRPSMFAFATLLWVLLPSSAPKLWFFQSASKDDALKTSKELLHKTFFKKEFTLFLYNGNKLQVSPVSAIVQVVLYFLSSLGRNLSLGHFLRFLPFRKLLSTTV